MAEYIEAVPEPPPPLHSALKTEVQFRKTGRFMGVRGLLSQCAVCQSWPAQLVCGACEARFLAVKPRCRLCAIALPADLSMGGTKPSKICASCLRAPPPTCLTLAALDYAYPWSNLITRFKFGDKPGWAPFFAGLMLRVPGTLPRLADLQPDDVVVPMPLSAQRLQERGFNQAWELTSQVARQSGSRATADARLLLRTRHTTPQSELRREARQANVRGAFQLEPLRAHLVAGKKLVLVDDVMTSGASLFAAAHVLRAAGASEVVALVLARTPAP